MATFFDAEAGFYDAGFDERTPGGRALRSRLDATLRLLGDRPGRVLDAGMGPGRLLAELSGRGWDVAGADLSTEMVSRARLRLPAAADGLLQGRLEALPFADAGFDAVVATGVLEYVDDLPKAVSELARVLRPEGIAVVSVTNPRSLFAMWRRFVIYPPARVVKRRFGGLRDAPPTGTRLAVARLHELLAAVWPHGRGHRARQLPGGTEPARPAFPPHRPPAGRASGAHVAGHGREAGDPAGVRGP